MNKFIIEVPDDVDINTLGDVVFHPETGFSDGMDVKIYAADSRDFCLPEVNGNEG